MIKILWQTIKTAVEAVRQQTVTERKFATLVSKRRFMFPVRFKGINVTYAEHQPEYFPLPVYKTEDGTVTSCWRMGFPERLKTLFVGRVYLSMMTFNQPLQPVLMSIDPPEEMQCE